MNSISHRLKRIEDRMRVDTGSRYSPTEWAAMRARLSPEEAAEYDDLYDSLASIPLSELSDDAVDRGAFLAEKMLGRHLRVVK